MSFIDLEFTRVVSPGIMADSVEAKQMLSSDSNLGRLNGLIFASI